MKLPVMQERFLSLGVWGDAAPYAHRDSLYMLLFNVISGRHHKRFWFATFPKRPPSVRFNSPRSFESERSGGAQFSSLLIALLFCLSISIEMCS